VERFWEDDFSIDFKKCYKMEEVFWGTEIINFLTLKI
jgi:hypothetical protein